jgi:integrase
LATFQKRSSGKWQARIRRDGQPPVSKTFATKADAEAWARAQEREMDRGAFIPSDTAQRTTLSVALDRYAEEVFPTLCGGGKFLRSNLERLRESLGALSLAALDASHISKFRDQCLKIGLAPQTVKHALGLLSCVLKTASIDWGVHLPRGLPTTLVRKPKLPNGRDRRLKSGEEEKLLKAARAYGGELMDIVSFALETAMRREEITEMRWEHVNLKQRVVLLPDTKNKEPRRVPLSPRALVILKARCRDLGPVWAMRPDSITHAFGRVCTRAKLENLHFHDLRHEATSRLFEKGLNMMEVAAITGHKTLEMLKRYTHLKAEDLAAKL